MFTFSSFYLLCFFVLPFLIFFWDFYSNNLLLQTEYVICFFHLLLLPVVFLYTHRSLACSPELYLSHRIVYTFHWVFVLGSFLWVSFMDPLLSLAASYWPRISVYTTVFIMARLGWSLFLMLLGTFLLVTLALKPKETLEPHPLLSTRIWKRGRRVILRNHWFSREDSLYRRYLNPWAPITVIAPVVLLSNHLFELNLSFGLLFFLSLSWLLYWAILLVGAISFYCALAPLEARTYRHWAKKQGEESSVKKQTKI